MALIPVSLVLSDFQTMYREHWSYVWGAARRGCVDCSGAFTYSYKLHGHSIYHGSNRIAREYVVELIPYSTAKANGLIVPGMAALKAHKPGDKNYSISSQYKKGGSHYNGDLNDYYHIGLVDDDINFVLNAQSPAKGFVRSPITQNWPYLAKLTDIDYGGVVPVGKTAIVTAPTGNTVNLRSSKSTSSNNIIARVPVGSTVTIIEDLGDWCRIQFGSKTGYMVSNYLNYESAPSDDNVDSDDILVDRDNLLDIYTRTINLANDIANILNIKG